MANDKVLDTAVIMAGGQGTRLLSITGPLPKAMVNIRGTKDKNFGTAKDTILEHQIDVLSQNGITNFIFVVGNKKEYIKNNFTNEIINNNVYDRIPYDRNINIRYFEEQVPLGTGGSFCTQELQDMTEGKDFLFTYSDVLFDVNIQDMYRFHNSQKADATVVVSPCTNPDDRPICIFDKENTEVVSMIQKQGKEDGPRGGVFTNTPKNGLIILSSSFFKVLPEDPTYLDFEDHILMKLIYDDSYKVCGWKSPCYIKDIGVVPRYYEGVRELSENIPELKNPAKHEQTCVIFRQSDLVSNSENNLKLNNDMAYCISELNNNGIITVLEKDIPLNVPKEDSLLDTILVRSKSPSYFNAKIDDLSQLNEIAQDWNIPANKTYYVANSNDACLLTNLEEGSTTTREQNILSAVNKIIFNHNEEIKSEAFQYAENSIQENNTEGPEYLPDEN